MAKDYPTPLIVPVDRTAARVTSAGYRYDSRKKLNPTNPTLNSPPENAQFLPPEFAYLAGTRKDNMTIVGYLGGTKLLARCVCGNYETRNVKTWVKPKGANDNCCQMCSHNRYLKRDDSLRQKYDR